MAEPLSGSILFYDEIGEEGVIITSTEDEYPFNFSGWKDTDHLPCSELKVTFIVAEAKASQITVCAVQKSAPPKREFDDIALTTEAAIKQYFKKTNEQLKKFSEYESIPKTVDFLKLRRFLMTTYNNLIEIDLKLKESNLSTLHRDLMILSSLYDSFRQKSKYIKRAFHDLFLNRHEEFTAAQNKLESNKLSISKHNTNIDSAENAIEKLEHIANKTPIASENYPVIQLKLSRVKAIAVDEIHQKRTLEEENLKLIQFIDMIINENEESFTLKYVAEAQIFDRKITQLLNKIAYQFDMFLWKTARNSESVKNFFQQSNIKGKLSTLSYLKYYLQSLNNDNLSSENKSLIELVPYLESLHRRGVLYLCRETEDGLKFKSAVTSIDKNIDISTSLTYDKAMEVIRTHIPDFIFIDYQAPELKKLLTTLKILQLADVIHIVLVVESSSDDLLERAKKLHVDTLLPTRVPPRTYVQSISDIFEKY